MAWDRRMSLTGWVAHTNCLHPKTKAARAACRKANAALLDSLTSALAEAEAAKVAEAEELATYRAELAEEARLRAEGMDLPLYDRVMIAMGNCPFDDRTDEANNFYAYLENAAEADSHDIYKDYTITSLTQAATGYAEEM